VASRGSKMALNNRKSGITFTVYMRQEGRVTVPKELRDAYDLKEGDLVECNIKKIK
jgi:AbrB family looped-hinge helix DNA binding protein